MLFLFSEVAKEEIFREILTVDASKACQDTYTLSRINKENANIFASFLHSSFNTSVINSEFLFGLLQGSILGILLFNIFVCDLLFMMSSTDFASYAVNNTPYVSADTIDEVIKSLETASVKLFKWFSDNQMKANQDKCHLIIGKNENISMYIDSLKIKKHQL